MTRRQEAMSRDRGRFRTIVEAKRSHTSFIGFINGRVTLLLIILSNYYNASKTVLV